MSWDKLKEIIDANRTQALEDKMKPITECPNCGFAPLKENKNGIKLCPICGWMEF